jgi:predicted transcriptional regulator
MDMTDQIKKNLISRIKDSKDLNFLHALQTIFDSSEQELYQLSSEQQASIEISRSEIKNGKFRKNEEVIAEMKEWLKKK